MDTATARKVSTAKGKFFFSKGAMRFFDSRILSSSWTEIAPDTYRFISSEKFDAESPRKYTIREFDVTTGDVETVGEFQQYETAAAAKACILV